MDGSPEHLLRYGSERDARTLMQDFLGRPVSPQALLGQIHRLKPVWPQAAGSSRRCLRRAQEVQKNMPTRIAAMQPHCSSTIRSRSTSAAKVSVTSG